MRISIITYLRRWSELSCLQTKNFAMRIFLKFISCVFSGFSSLLALVATRTAVQSLSFERDPLKK